MSEPIIFVPEVDLSPNLSIALNLARRGDNIITGSRESGIGPFLGVRHIHYPVDDDILHDVARNKAMAHKVLEALPPDRKVLAICGSDRALGMLSIVAECHPAFVLCYPDADTQYRITSKTAARDGFAVHGLPVPKGRNYKAGDSVGADTWQYPAIFKYDTSEGSLGVHVVEDAETLDTFAAKAALLETPFIVEEFIGPTREISYSFFIRDGRVFPAFGLEKEFHFRTSYSTTIRFMSQAEDETAFARFHPGFVGLLGDGFYCAQFKETNGGMVLIEINGRLGNNFRIINRVVPDLAGLIVDFYRKIEGWDAQWVAMRYAIRPVHGVSLIEDLYARMAQIGSLVRRGAWRGAGQEVALGLGVMAKRPYLDDYVIALLRRPRYAFQYYSAFFAAARSQKQSTIALKKMVSR